MTSAISFLLLLIVWRSRPINCQQTDTFPTNLLNRQKDFHKSLSPESPKSNSLLSIFETYPLDQRAQWFHPVAEGDSLDHIQIAKTMSSDRTVVGNYFRITDIARLKVLPPLAGCGEGFSKATETMNDAGCIAAMSAGFFHPKGLPDCIGNVVHDGEILQSEDRVNANFGLTKSGAIFTGYVNSSEIANAQDPFTELVAGLGWIVKNRENNVEESLQIEDLTVQPNDNFDTQISGRGAIGYDENGHVIFVGMDGKREAYGINLYEFADLLIELGLVNAVNLAAGGAVTSALSGGLLANYPSDICEATDYFPNLTLCERDVTTIICVTKAVDLGSSEFYFHNQAGWYVFVFFLSVGLVCLLTHFIIRCKKRFDWRMYIPQIFASTEEEHISLLSKQKSHDYAKMSPVVEHYDSVDSSGTFQSVIEDLMELGNSDVPLDRFKNRTRTRAQSM